LVIKACDIGAYFTGKAMGRHKMIPWLSPGKTWEGLLGGVLLSGLVASGIAALFNHLQDRFEDLHLAGAWCGHDFVPASFSLVGAAAAGVLIGLVGQLGDLTASVFKRDADIKDSGSSIPGFGGILDVTDSPLIAAPLAYWMLILLAANT